MIKMIASDLDGTLLLNKAQELSQDLFPLIRQLKEMGILFVAASGRQYPNMKKLFEPVADDIAYICENGAMAIRDEQVLYQNNFDMELVKEIMKDIYDTEGCELTCSTKDFYYLMPKTETFFDIMVRVIRNEGKIIQDFSEMTEPCMKVAVYNEKGLSDEFINFWQERVSEKCKAVVSGNEWLDFVPYETNKAKGIEAFLEKLKILPEECVVFGDECNDIEMLKCVPNSFAMSHSKENVKSCASYQTDRVEKILKQIIENNGELWG